MARCRLDKKSRGLLFEYLKKKHGARSLKELAEKLGKPYKTLKNWAYGTLLTPEKIIAPEIADRINVIERKPENWGAIKGGKTGIRIVWKKYGADKVREWRSRGGRKSWRHAVAKLKEISKKEPKRFYWLMRKKKIAKRIKAIEASENTMFFQPKTMRFDNKSIVFSKNDLGRRIKTPEILSTELSEETGIHVGDGTLPKKKYYFSVRGDANEADYYKDYIKKLYKRIYNLDVSTFTRGGVAGFEVNSKALYEFKDKILRLPVGEKVNRVKVPNCIIASKDKEIYRSFLRGVFDTDGCISISRKRMYPVISIGIRSTPLIKKIGWMLKKLGFLPAVNIKRQVVSLNGRVMVEKWTREIGSHNPKHIKRIEHIKSMLP